MPKLLVTYGMILEGCHLQHNPNKEDTTYVDSTVYGI